MASVENSTLPNSNDEEDLSQELTEKLLHFQEITNIEDLKRCKEVLRQHNWDVESAVQSTFVDRTIQNDEIQQSNTELRRRNVGTIPPPLPVRNFVRAGYYEARRDEQPQGFFSWSLYLLSFPFRFTYTTFFSIFRFVWRIFVPDPRARITDPRGDVRTFIEEYKQKFGDRHPVFFQGTYADAQSESRKQIKFLMVYLHGPDHQDTAEFCEKTLSDDDVVALIQRNCLFWSCSVNTPEGYRVSRALRENTYPFIALICQFQGKMTVIGRLEGPLTPQEFLDQVSGMIERYEPLMITVRAERAERDMTQQIRSEQDEAYQQSLLQDKEKEERKRQEEEIKRKQECEIEEREKKKQEEKEKYLTRKKCCKHDLPVEANCSDPCTLKLMIKLPDGSRLSRNFLSSDPVKSIHDFVFCQDNAPQQFQIVTNFPRRIIPGCTTSEIIKLEEDEREEAEKTKIKLIEDDGQSSSMPCNRWMSIEEAGLKSSEMLFVHSLDDTDDEDSPTER